MDEEPQCNIEAIKAEVFVVNSMAIMQAMLKGKRSGILKDLRVNNFPVPKLVCKVKYNLSTVSTCASDEDSEENNRMDHIGVIVNKNQQFEKKSFISERTESNTFSSNEGECIYTSQKAKLILERLADFKQGMKIAFTEKEYQAFTKISRLLVNALQFYEEDFRRKTITSIIYCILILICGYLSISKRAFWKAMSVERGLKDNLRIDRIKGTACYLNLKKVFKKIVKCL